MTNDIVQQITEAETLATACKQTAETTAKETLDRAQERAGQILRSAEEVCKAYKISQRKTAIAEAEADFQRKLATANKEAKAYCAQMLEKAEPCVSEIVGRILRGDC